MGQSTTEIFRTISTLIICWAVTIANGVLTYKNWDFISETKIDINILDSWKLIIVCEFLYGLLAICYAIYSIKHIACHRCESLVNCVARLTCIKLIFSVIFNCCLVAVLFIGFYLTYIFYKDISIFHDIYNNYNFVYISYCILFVSSGLIVLIHLITYMTEFLKCITCDYCCCPKRKEEIRTMERREIKYRGKKHINPHRNLSDSYYTI